MTFIKDKWWTSRPLQVVILLLFVAVVYLPCLSGGFISDDHRLVETRQFVYETPGSWLELVKNVYWWNTNSPTARQELYRPLTSLTFWFDCRLSGVSPLGYHLSNYVIHLANSALVFVLMLPLVGQGMALGITALASLNPVALTSVGWISGRTDLWATLFMLLFLVLFRSALTRKSHWLIAMSAFSLFLGLMSKEIAVVAIVLAWLLDYVSPISIPKAGNIRRPTWHYFAMVVPIVVYFIIRRSIVGAFLAAKGVATTTLSDLPILAERFLRTLWHVLIPTHYNFTSEILWSNSGSRGVGFIIGWMIFLAILVFIIVGLRRKQLWAFGAAWFACSLLLVYGLGHSFGPVVDFYAYAGLPGLWLAVFEGIRIILPRIAEDKSKVFALARYGVIGLALIFGVQTATWLSILSSDLNLNRYCAEQAPNSAAALTKYGEVLSENGDDDAALVQLNRAVQVNPKAWEPHNAIARIYLNHKDARGAAPYADALAELAPKQLEAQAMIARFYFEADHCQEAVSQYEYAFSLGAPEAEILFDCGLALVCAGMDTTAIDIFEYAIRMKPLWPQAYNNLGVCYENVGQKEKATAAYEQAVKLDPTNGAWESLAILYAQAGKRAEAHRAALNYISLNPSSERIENLKRNLSDAGINVADL